MMVSLGDERAKYIGEVIGNKSCKRILELLAEEVLPYFDGAKYD